MDSEESGNNGERTTPVFRLIYISSPTRDMSSQELKDLLEWCLGYNPPNGITGLLLYRPGMFMQVLEGEESEIRALYTRIKRDTRHRDVTDVSSGNVPMRRFDHWSMAFRDLRDPALIGMKGFSEFLNMPMIAIPFLLHPTRLEELLLAFRAMLDETP